MSGERGPARDTPSAPLEKAGTHRAPRLHSFAGSRAGSRAGPRCTASPPFPLANLFPSLDPSDRMLGPHPDSRGSKLGPEPASSEVHSTCLLAAGVPRGDVCLRPPRSGLRASASALSSAFPMRTVLSSRAAPAPCIYLPFTLLCSLFQPVTNTLDLFLQGFSSGSPVKICLQCRRLRRHGFDPWVGKIPCKRTWKPTPVFLPGESHGQRSLGNHSP